MACVCLCDVLTAQVVTSDYVEDTRIKLGVSKKAAGSISWVSDKKRSSNSNFVNVYDKGRLIQQSYYSGYTYRPAYLWKGSPSPETDEWGWNPVEGSSYKDEDGEYRLESIQISNGGRRMVVKSTAVNWAERDPRYSIGYGYFSTGHIKFEKTIDVKYDVARVIFTVRVVDNSTMGVYPNGVDGHNNVNFVPRHQEQPATFLNGSMGYLRSPDPSGFELNPSSFPDVHSNQSPGWRYVPSRRLVSSSQSMGSGVGFLFPDGERWDITYYKASGNGSTYYFTPTVSAGSTFSHAAGNTKTYTYYIVVGDSYQSIISRMAEIDRYGFDQLPNPDAVNVCSKCSDDQNWQTRTFDVQYYLGRSQHKDLRDAFGSNNWSAAAAHWYTHNEVFGNQTKCERRVGKSDFNVDAYRNHPRNSDLNSTFKDNWYCYFWHYKTYGYKENRRTVW